MRKCTFVVVVAVLLVGGLLTASASKAQVVLNAVGSSGVFTTTGLAAISPDPVTGAAALCGTNFWSGGSGAASSLAFAIDSRNAGIPHEPGTIWVAWDVDAAPTKVCTYLSVDSVVGDRLMLSQNGAGNATLNLNAVAQYTVGANKVSFAADNTNCAASGGPGPFNVVISEPNNSSTATVTVFGGGNFGNDFANGASLTIAASGVAAFDISGGTVANVTQLSPTTFTYTTTTENTSGAALVDNSGTATATVVANCPGLPLAVFNAINGTHFSMGFTDIRPEDAHYFFSRATCALNVTDSSTACMGYSSNPASPQGVKSSFSQGIAFGLDFALFGGTDPISSVPVPAGTIVDVGAVPVMWFASNRDVSACGLGNAAFNNVNVMDLQNMYQGFASATQEISATLVSTAAGCPTALHAVQREPFSGTYNTAEWQEVRSFRDGQGSKSQEYGNVGYPQSNNNLGTACPAWATTLPASTPSNPTFPPFGAAPPLGPTCGNPLNIQSGNYPAGTPSLGTFSGFGGNRTRAIGSGEMISAVNSTNITDAIGYAFYSVGSFGGKANIKYVTLDGADPLWPSYDTNPYGNGIFPTCTGKLNLGTFACPHGQPTFDGIKTGRYSNWNVIRAIYYGGVSACAAPFTAVSAGCLIQAAQDQANPVNGNVKDYVPVVYCANGACSSQTYNLTYFRAHYFNTNTAGHNGYIGGTFTPGCAPAVPESGGDVAGAIIPVNLEIDRLNSIGCGTEFIGYYQ